MEKEDITPEEKLLKIIESGQAARRKLPPAADNAQTAVGVLISWFRNIRISKESFRFFSPEIINRTIIAGCILSTVFYAVVFLKSKVGLRKRFEQASGGTADIAQGEKPSVFPEPNTTEILNQARIRNIFTFFPSNIREARQEDGAGAIDSLKLVGIIWSDKPQAMIENTKEQKTYLLSAGENVGEVKVKKILRDKAVLDVEGKEWELR